MTLPEGWRSVRLKYVVRRHTERSKPGLPVLNLENVESWTGLQVGETAAGDGEALRYRDGDVLFGKLRPYLAKVLVARSDGACTSEMLVLRPRAELTQRFLFYRMIAPDFINVVNASTFGSKMPRADWEFIGNLYLSIPSPDEQTRICNCLDGRLSGIDALVAKKQRLIDLLEEKRAALISRAVTQGLDPNVPMKDSGVEWLGRVPAHWEVCQLRRKWQILDCKHRTPLYVDEGIPIVSTAEVSGGRLNLETERRTTPEEFVNLTEGGRRPRRGDLIYSRNASLGSAAYVDRDDEFCMGQDVSLIRSRLQSQQYLAYQLNSRPILYQLRLAAVGSTFLRINVNDIAALRLCCPPCAEQCKIAEHLNRASEQIRAAQELITSAIERLREYRSALITAAVTGQLDLRKHERELEVLVGGAK